jgi:site-specific recombinase XerD
MMPNVSDECGLSKRYTNHCIRSTCITALNDGGFETRHIMGLSGHKSESAVRSYTKKLSEKKTRQMSSVLSSTVRSTTTEAIVDQQGTIATNNVSNAAAGPVSNAPAHHY